MSVSQAIFNQYRESKIIEMVQGVAKSAAGPLLAFKGGTALRLFWDLPRFSEDLDYTLLQKEKKKDVFKMVHDIAVGAGYEITDEMIKFKTVLFEFRFRWAGPTFHLKIEISDPLPADTARGNFPVRVALLRGVPVYVMLEDRIMAQKLCAFMDREAPRDMFDLWFILEKRLRVDWAYVAACTGLRKKAFFLKGVERVRRFPRTKLVSDLGKLVSAKDRQWIKTNFLDDLVRLLEREK